jgi:hypothetical protein
MPTPEEWGPATWTLFHTLAEKMKDEAYPVVGRGLFSLIFRICGLLPCPDCSRHAKDFLSKVNPASLKTREEFRNMLYLFHNMVNKRKGKPLYNSEGLPSYKDKNLVQVMNQFLRHYNNRGNMQMLTESFQRQFIVADLKKWVNGNHRAFV